VTEEPGKPPLDEAAVFRRVLLKLSGETFGGGKVGVDATIVRGIAEQLAEVAGDGGARYRFYTDGTSAPGLTVEAAAAALPQRIGAFYLGTLGLVLEPIASTLEDLLGRVAPDTLVALDPNCRPSAIPDPATYRARLERLLRRADVVKVSEEDLEWLDPGTEPVAAARRLLAGRRAVALLTRGGDGAVVDTAEEARPVTAPAVAVVDTIGAGDAFMGGFLARWRARGLGRADLSRIDAVQHAVAYACVVAAITCSRAAASAPLRALMK
jgi:fructokinase